MSFKDGSALIVGKLLPSPILRETATRSVFDCVGSSLFTAVPSMSVPSILQLFSCSFLSMNFQLVKGRRFRLRQKPATAQNHPAPNDGNQACISNAKAMAGRPSRPALSRAPFPRVEPWLVRTFRSEPLSARCSLAPKLCPRDAPSFRSLTRAPIARSEVWPVRWSAVPPLRTFACACALLRLSFAPSPRPCLFFVATPRLCPPNRWLCHV